MSKLFDLIGGEEISVDARWSILDVLYDSRPLFIATGCISVASIFGWLNGLSHWAAGWEGSALLVLVGRMLLSRAYRRRSPHAALQPWKLKFFIGNVVTGLQWGWGATAFLYTSDSSILCTVFAVQTALMAGASARTCCFPPAALAQVAATALIIAVCGAMAGVWVFVCLMILFVAY